MTYTELIQQKKKKTTLAKRIFYVNLVFYLGLFIFITLPSLMASSSSFILILIPIILFVPGLILLYTLPQSIKKRNKLLNEITDEFGDAVIHEHYATTLPNSKKMHPILKKVMLIFYSLLCYLVAFILYDLLLPNNLHTALIAITLATSIVYIFRLIFSDMDYELIFTDTHVIYNYREAVALKSISKYQFIKLIKDGYMLDINTGKAFLRMRINQVEKESIQSRLEIF